MAVVVCAQVLTSRSVTGEAKRYWVNDNFTDNDTTGWAMADLDADGTTSGGTTGPSRPCVPTTRPAT